VWNHGDEHAKRPDGKLPLGRADFLAGKVAQAFIHGYVLRLEIAEPPPRHANVIGWPDISQPELRNQLAMELRDKANPTVTERTPTS
jgi:hypothetical protein